ncbi:MAG: AMP-binding protein [Muribaculaceae bacterium]|nr:AMP-binding protein [Muribaculaceae bacterium]
MSKKYEFEGEYGKAPYDDLLEIYAQSFADNFSLPALTDYSTGKTLTYGSFAQRIARLHLFFELTGVMPGDKIALLGKNTPTWVVTFMATISYGAVIVPILSDFTPADATHIINHSDAVMLFVSDSSWNELKMDDFPELRCVVSIDQRKVVAENPDALGWLGKGNRSYASVVRGLSRRFRKRYPNGFSAEDIRYPKVDGSATAVINYTSGTTGFSKGVMLSMDNLRGNVVFGIRSRLHYCGSRALSFLPLAHAYGCAFDMLVPLAVGTHITLFGRIPTPALLVKAMNQVKPSLIICVPLILEKIYRNMIVPMISKPSLRWVLAVPLLDKALYAMIRSKLVEAFGGAFEEVIVGGAALNPEVEDFLHKIHFPFTVGYGMTECGPLISYTPWRRFVPTSAGRTLSNIMEAKILRDESLPLQEGETPQGEIMVRGLNVMKGYYKNPEATEAVLEEDGWLHTGDMGMVADPGGRTIYIRGRYKTMILSANGQNIYPEEIEAKLSNMPYVSECLVVDRDGHLFALVYPDPDAMAEMGAAQMAELMETNRKELNSMLAPYERIEGIELQPVEFEKTPKRSIRRFLYK